MANARATIRDNLKNQILDKLMADYPAARKVGDFTIAIPMGEVEDNGKMVPIAAKIEVRVPNWYATENHPAFDFQQVTYDYAKLIADNRNAQAYWGEVAKRHREHEAAELKEAYRRAADKARKNAGLI